eukprot:Opistho-2@8266
MDPKAQYGAPYNPYAAGPGMPGTYQYPPAAAPGMPQQPPTPYGTSGQVANPAQYGSPYGSGAQMPQYGPPPAPYGPSGMPPQYGAPQGQPAPYQYGAPQQQPQQPQYAPQGGPPLASTPSGGVAGDLPPQFSNLPPGELPAGPTAPPADLFPALPGYEAVGNAPEGFAQLPPAYEPPVQPVAARNYRITTTNITEDAARAALLAYVDKQCCYGKGAANDLVFTDIRSGDAFHYRMESWGEHRSVAWTMEPYRGTPLDGPERGPAPAPWTIPVPTPAPFNNHTMAVEVPHTASQRACYKCGAQGYVRCDSCFGRGSDVCISCDGRGMRVGLHVDHHNHHHHHGGHHHNSHSSSVHAQAQICMMCQGSGRRTCVRCHGRRVIVCSTCEGCRILKLYLKMTVKWTNHVTDSVVDQSGLPSELVSKAQGDVAVQEDGVRVIPIVGFQPLVDSTSQTLVAQHAQAFPSERIHNQRQTVRVVPVSRATYNYKNKALEFWVYGHEHCVHAPKYPHTCLCCTIL